MIVETHSADLGGTLRVGQQGIDIDVPSGGTVELSRAVDASGHPRDGFVCAVVRNSIGAATRELTLDERDVARPISVEREL